MINRINPNTILGVGIILAVGAPVIYFLFFHDDYMRALTNARNFSFMIKESDRTQINMLIRGTQLAHAAVFFIGLALAFFGWRRRNAGA